VQSTYTLLQGARGERKAPRSKRALRNRAHATRERAVEILDEALTGATDGGIVVVPPLKAKVEEKLGKPIALSTLYRMLARNGWRKLASDTAHPKGNAVVRDDWKKTSGECGRNGSNVEQSATLAVNVPRRGAIRTYLGHPLLLVSSPH